MEEKIIRISNAYFPPEQTETVESMLNNEFKNSLVPAIKKLKGNINFYVGIDKEKCAMTNVSLWQTLQHAKQMDTLKEMLESREPFEALGVKFEKITNHQVLWEL